MKKVKRKNRLIQNLNLSHQVHFLWCKLARQYTRRSNSKPVECCLIESVIFYYWPQRSLIWTIQECWTILNKSWTQHPTKQQLCSHLPPISKTTQIRQTRHVGHSWRSKDELISEVLLWSPTHGCASDGRPTRTYLYHIYQPLRSGRIWHKVNFLSGV